MVDDFLSFIELEDALHYKKIVKTLEEFPEQKTKLLDFFEDLQPYFEHLKWDMKDVASAYLFIVNKMFESRLEFIRSGEYPINNETQTLNYNDKKLMLNYMFGLVISQYLWRHHIETFNFYLDSMKNTGKVQRLLEIGAGQGYYLSKVLPELDPDEITIVDISQNSIDMAKELFQIKNEVFFEKINFQRMDINIFKAEEKFDLIIMYGVLSCLENPVETLKKVRSLLAENGKMFLFACSNCPTPDHTFRFETPDHIKQACTEAGLSIIDEKISLSEDVPHAKIEKLKLDIAHAIMLQKG